MRNPDARLFTLKFHSRTRLLAALTIFCLLTLLMGATAFMKTHTSALHSRSGAQAVSAGVAARTAERATLLTPITGEHTICTFPGDCDYTSLAAAIADLNANGVGTGGVIFSIDPGHTETAPVGGITITATGTLADPITIRKNPMFAGDDPLITAFGGQTSGNLNDAVIKIIGGDYITIDQLALQENAANTTTTAGTNNMTEWGIALLYASTTNGAQNNTIKNCTITLNRTYQNTFGIYSNVRHSATSVTVAADITSPNGANSNLHIYSNNISNVNIGMAVIGSTTGANMDTGLDIGGNGAATGNTISNYGTTGTFSAYVSVSGTVNGILLNNQLNFNTSYNSITSSNGGTTSGTLRGIYVQATGTLPTTGSISGAINNNTISIKSAVATGAMVGIANELGNLITTITINNNDFNNTTHTVAASGAITFILQSTGAPLNESINNNTFTNMTVNTTGSVTFINKSVTHPANSVLNVNNNSIVTGFSKTGAGGTVMFYDSFGTSPSSVTETNTGNNFSNVTLTGATTLSAWRSADGPTGSPFGPSKTVTNNTFSNITGGTSSVTILTVGFSNNASTNNNVSGNTVSNISGGGAVLGITSSQGAQNFFSNTINTLSTTGAAAVTGLSLTGGTTQNVFKNKIYDLSGSNATSTVNGLLFSTIPTTANIYNNLIGDLRASVASAANPVNGINITGTTATTTLNVSFNTVYLNATSTGTNFGSSALSAATSATATSATLNLKDNILVNLSTPNGTGLTVAYRRSSTTLTNYGAASNNNDFYAGAPSASRLIFADGTNADQTLSAYKTRVSPRDSASITENPPFLSTTGSSADFLHINPSVATQLESGGMPVSGITDDYDGQTRNASTPDIGADEFTGTVLDLAAPVITYTALSNTAQTSNRTLSVTITDVTGVAGGSLSPRIYFRKGMAGSYSSTQCVMTGGTAQNGTWSCTIDHSLIGGVTTGDTVQYFVVAQDTAGNLGSTPGGAMGTDVNNITTPPATPAQYNIVAAIPSSLNVGTGQTYTSLTNVGGLFEALNAGVLTGNVTVNITSNLTGETGTVALNQLAEDPPGGFTVTIRPVGNNPLTISGSSTTGIIRLIDADRITIDGSLPSAVATTQIGGDPSLRMLTIQNTSTTATAGAVIVVGSNVNGAQNVTIKNVNVVGQDPTQTLIGIHMGGTAPGSVGTDNDNNRIQNCNFQKAFIGIYNSGNSAANPNTGNVITMNDMSSTGANRLRRAGMLFFNQSGIQVTLNRIGGIVSDEGIDAYGIGAGVQNVTTTNTASGGVSNATITQNLINGISSTSTTGFSAYGIGIEGDPVGANTIANNMILNVIAPSTAPDIVAGIFVGGVPGSTTRVYHNSVSLTGARGAVASQIGSYGVAISGSNPVVELKNNIFYNTQTSGGGATAKSYAIGTASSTFTNMDSNFNLFFTSGAQAGGFRTGSIDTTGTDFATLAGWQGATNKDANSLSVDPQFISPSADLHLQATSPAINAGTTLAAVTTDIDGDTRDASPDIGADELVFNLSIADVTTREGDEPGFHNVTFTVTLSAPSTQAVSVSYHSASTGSATQGVDFQFVGGQIFFAPMQTTETFSIGVAGDVLDEGNETFAVDLSSPNGASISDSQSIATIIDDDINSGDFDGDGINDPSVFRPNADNTHTAKWYILNSGSANRAEGVPPVTEQQFGAETDIPAAGDYDGNGSKDIAVFRPDDDGSGHSAFYVSKGSAQNFDKYVWGLNGDQPVPGDYDGDLKTDVAVFRPSDGNWYIRKSSDGSLLVQQWGLATDRRAPADYDADGKTDFAVVRNNDPVAGSATWYIRKSTDGSLLVQQWGVNTDKLVPADYDADGKADIAVWRPTDGFWYILQSSSNTLKAAQWGMMGDVPVVGDYEFDGKADLAVWRPSSGIYFIQFSSDGSYIGPQWGQPGDVPIASRYVPEQ